MFVLIDRRNLILKYSGRKSFLNETKASMTFILIRRMSLWCPIMKERRLLCEFMFVLNNKWTLTLKNGKKRSFSFETKASMSFILMRKMSLWFPIMKRKEILVWIYVFPNWQMKFNTKKLARRKAFLLNPKHQCHLSKWGE